MAADIVSYGIVPDGRNVGEGLMKAMKELGEVVLTEGVYTTGPIDVPSGTHLVLEEAPLHP